MKPLNFNELMRMADEITDPNAKELFLYEAHMNYQQTVLDAENFRLKIETAITYFKKVRELTAPEHQQRDEVTMDVKNLKVSTYLLFELFRMAGIGRDKNDLTTLSKFASLINGYSWKNIMNNMQKGITFTEQQHGAMIQEVNAVLKRLEMPYPINISK